MVGLSSGQYRTLGHIQTAIRQSSSIFAIHYLDCLRVLFDHIISTKDGKNLLVQRPLTKTKQRNHVTINKIMSAPSAHIAIGK